MLTALVIVWVVVGSAVMASEVRHGMNLRRLGRIRPCGTLFAQIGFDLQDRLMRR